jgi:hypothetical protein
MMSCGLLLVHLSIYSETDYSSDFNPKSPSLWEHYTSLNRFPLSVSTLHFPELVPFVCEHFTLPWIGSLCLWERYMSLNWFPLSVRTLHVPALVPFVCEHVTLPCIGSVNMQQGKQYQRLSRSLFYVARYPPPPPRQGLLSPEVQSRLSDLSGTDRWSDYRKDRIMRKFVQRHASESFWIHSGVFSSPCL